MPERPPAIDRIIRRGYSRVTGGADLGSLKESAHTTAAYLTMEVMPDLFITFLEYSARGLASEDVFEWVTKENARWKVEEWWFSHEQSRANQLLRGAHINVHDAPRYQGARDDGVALIKRLLNVEQRGDGTKRPALYVTEDCPRLINAIETYMGERKDDDELDGWRYNIMLATKGRMKAVRSEIAVMRPAGVIVKKDASKMMDRLKEDRRSRWRKHLEKMEV